MTEPTTPRHVWLAFRGEAFRFMFDQLDDDVLRGRFAWDDAAKAKLVALENQLDDEGDWYLDDDGDRLEDDKLFESSPWTMLDQGGARKVVCRFTDYRTGEASFRLAPWFRITPLG